MKKLVTLAVAALLAMSVSAQKGSMYLGASTISFWGGEKANDIGTGFFYVKNGDASTSIYGISPEFGYFLSDNLAIAGIVGISGSSTKANKNADAVKEFTFKINPYARYFLIQDGNFGFYLQGGVNFETETEAKWTKFGIMINPGVSYAISSKFTATAAFGNLGFQSTKQKDASDATNVFGLNLNMSTLNFGLSYTF